ncbi:putative disease resistance RPP8-like protein 4 [Sesamum angolense]|uniref:Disease resistance RPP8-like protein 4 n=1 Tax=Sesamum angolense TaxID=2727404 RepID=A0AAE2BR91_9LAMI|nr:putative disease resistance RPP8-like protein 4 [Sesamum angolense]
MPGLGKTTLAGKIFRDPGILYEFPTRIWVYVSQDFTRKNIFLAILREFTRIDEEMYHKTDQELARLVASDLERGKFLLVMDDVWTAEDWEKTKLLCQRAIRWVFGKPECPPELEVLGKLIVDQCDRLPLAIVVIGGILVKKFSASDDISAKRNAWTKVSNSVSTYLSEDPGRRMEKIIALSYDKLPYHLRACFLYLGMFPEDFEIPVWKLIRMWIAEGFIQEKSEAGNERENFLQEMKRSSDGFEPSVAEVQKFRRLCIHSSILSFISARPYGPRVRSFVCFSKEEVALPTENVAAIPAAFKLLRVLEVKPIKFTKIPSDMYQLVHLRQMHPLLLPKTGKSSKEGEKLRTLGTVSPQSCTEEVFERARNLKKLGIRGRLAMLIDGKSGSFDSLGKLENLDKLKLLNDVFPSPPSEGQLRLMENLEVLKLKNKSFTGKCWQAADGGFRRLEVLHIGRTDLVFWIASAHHFPRLRRLELHNCEELKEVPIGLAEIENFQVLDLYRTKFAAASAKKIGDAKKKKEEQNGKVGAFKLSIFPVEE